MNKLKFILKREWLESAKTWEDAVDRWSRNKTFPADEVAKNVAGYKQWEDRARSKALDAPVKIVLHYEDGRTETIE